MNFLEKIHPIPKNFLFLWIFQLISLFGSELTRFAFPIWLFQQEENLTSFSFFVACGLFPRILSPILGGLTDRFNEKNVLITAGISLTIISLIMFAITSGFLNKNFLLICFLIFSMGFFGNLIHITTISIIPKLVGKSQLLSTNSYMLAAESSTAMLCPLIAGSIAFKFGISTVILLDMLLLISSFIFLDGVKIEQKINKKETAIIEIKNNLYYGIQFIKNNKLLLRLLIVSGLINFIFSLSFVAFTPMILSSSYKDIQLLVKIFSIGSATQLATSLFTGYFLKSDSPISLMMKSIIALGLCGPCIIGLQFSPIFWTIGYASTLALLTIINSANNAFWQTYSPSNLQGTIFGIRRMISSLLAPIGTLLGGPLITLFFNFSKPSYFDNEYQILFVIAGILILAIGLSGLYLTAFEPLIPSTSEQNE